MGVYRDDKTKHIAQAFARIAQHGEKKKGGGVAQMMAFIA